MLTLVLGRGGTGKTHLLFEQIAQAVAQGKKCILLVPEQASFESEKQLYRKLGAKASLSTEALSFTRLCDSIFRRYGGLAGTHLDETGKLLLMSLVLGEVTDVLGVYQKNAGNAAFAAVMCETVGELKSAGVTAEQLRRTAENASLSELGNKLNDLSIIYDAFCAAVARGYDDPDDHLARACELLTSDFFDGYHLFIDGFMAFMGGEWKLLERILSCGCDVTAAFPCEGLSVQNAPDAFAAATHTASRMVETAKRCGAQVAKPIMLDSTARYLAPALAVVAQDYPHIGTSASEIEPDGTYLSPCEDFYDELETVAAEICALVRAGYRYRDIAVVARSLERYLAPMRTVFARYDIPFFTDMRLDIEVHPLVHAVIHALGAVRTGFTSEHMLSLAQNALCGMESGQAGLLENYCFTWNVTGSGWQSAFVNNPEGMTDGFTAAQERQLVQINETREMLTKPLFALKHALLDCDGRGFATGIFSYLEQLGAGERLQMLADGMREQEAKEFLEISAQVWDALISLLDVFGGALGETRLPLTRLVDLFLLGIASIRIGVLPQTIDQVLVGTADRIRPNAPRAVFVIGLNEGEFPLWGGAGGLLSMNERELLRAQGVDLLRTAEQQALFEKYYVYFALTQASERLYLTYPQRDTAGTGLSPSSVLERIEQLFEVKITSINSQIDFARVQGEKTALDRLTRLWHEPGAERNALYAHFADTSPDLVETLEQLSGTRHYALQSDEGQALFAGNMHLSPSRIERYNTCPFSYFCQSGLRLKVRRRAEFNPLESGSLIHFVLEQMVKQHGGAGLAALPPRTLREQVDALVREHLLARIPDFEGMPERFKYLFQRLVSTLTRLLMRLGEEFAQSEFVPVAFELPVGADDVPPLLLQTPAGTQITVEGVIDRVDELVRDGKRYIRVVDYKSGQKQFRLSDICHGLNLQMLIYLFALCDAPAKDDAQNMPAGVLYMPARDKIVSAERGADDVSVEKERVKLWKMSGLLLEDITSLSGMERDLAGVFIPIKRTKDGGFDSARSSLATLAQMGGIRRSIERQIITLAEQLQAGGIAACPIEGAQNVSPCEWCDYHAVCGHEEQDETRAFAALDKAEAMKKLEEVGKDG